MPEEDAVARIANNINEDTFPLVPPANSNRWKETNKALERSSLLYDFDGIWQAFHGEGVKVAVLDSGIDIDHPAFPAEALHSCVRFNHGQLTVGREAVRDFNGHGTHCAGIIAARPLHWKEEESGGRYVPYEPKIAAAATAGNGAENLQCDRHFVDWSAKGGDTKKFCNLDVRFSGVAPRAKLMVYKVTRHEKENGNTIDHGVARVDDLVQAIVHAVNHHADVISISIQSEDTTAQLYRAIHWALSLRKIIICSAGNQGRRQQVNVGYPARYGGVITVGAVTRYGQPAGFTSVGGEVDIGAPGENVWSTWKDNSYAKQSGTSMAAPWVAGIAALLLSKHREFEGDPNRTNETPIRNNEEMRQHILRMAAHPGHYDPSTGYGALWPGDYFAREAAL